MAEAGTSNMGPGQATQAVAFQGVGQLQHESASSPNPETGDGPPSSLSPVTAALRTSRSERNPETAATLDIFQCDEQCEDLQEVEQKLEGGGVCFLGQENPASLIQKIASLSKVKHTRGPLMSWKLCGARILIVYPFLDEVPSSCG